jgi:hypothetical protein
MSVQMVRDLRALVTERGPGVYLVTVSAQGGPHTVYTTARWEGGAIVAEAGTTTAANAAARPLVSLLFPVRADGDYSLIVDGLATLDAVEPGARLRVSPTKAVARHPRLAAADRELPRRRDHRRPRLPRLEGLAGCRGAPRLRRGAPSVGGIGGPCRGPP